jgi:hypothetical protein
MGTVLNDFHNKFFSGTSALPVLDFLSHYFSDSICTLLLQAKKVEYHGINYG